MFKNLPLFLCITFVVNGMELIQKDRDCLYYLTVQLGSINKWNIEKTKRTIKNFACANKAFYAYYKQEKTGQEIVKNFALHNSISDCDCAKLFGYKTIAHKIEKLFGSPPYYILSFQASDLHDRWYLNATNSFDVVPDPQTLLHRSIEFMDLTRIKILFEANINFHNRTCEHVLSLALRRYFCSQNNRDACCFFSIIVYLLEKHCDPDIKIPEVKSQTTGLMYAASKGDQKIAHLLLEYGANPYEIYISEDDKMLNCFDMEQGQPKGWLKELYNVIRQ